MIIDIAVKNTSLSFQNQRSETLSHIQFWLAIMADAEEKAKAEKLAAAKKRVCVCFLPVGAQELGTDVLT